MNLVQIQERLKDAPVQAIMQYANGGNPMVPPYLALAELKRRESINQSAQTQQAMQRGQPPSVKEQIEQAAGLAALQQQMQQQGLQGLMAQAQPAGIPENVPQPRRQPESQGIAGLPADNMNFAEGGIVAFAGPQGSYVGDKDAAEEQRRADQERAKQLARSTGMSFEEALAAIKDIATLPVRGILGALETGITRPLRAAGLDIPYLPKETYGGDAASITPYMDALRRQRQQAIEGGYAAKEAARAAAVKTPEGAEMMRGKPAPVSAEPPKFEIAGDYESAMRSVMAIPDPAERMAAMEALQRAQRTGTAQQQPAAPAAPGAAPALGIAALPGADVASQKMLDLMNKQSTPEEIYAAGRKLEELYGMTQPYGEERMKRIRQMEEDRKKMLEDRGMERLMRVMGGIAGRGLQGAGPAYQSAIEGERASDVAFRKQMDELLSGVEEKRRAEQAASMQRGIGQMGEERKLSMGAAEEIYKAQRRREDEVAKVRLEHQLRMMQPNEASILLNVMADLRKRNPDKSEAEIYAMAREAQQGATPALKEQDQRLKAMNKAIEEWNNPLISMEKKNPQKLSEEQWIAQKAKYYEAIMKGQYDALSAAGASGSAIPPIPAGAVRLKGAQ